MPLTAEKLAESHLKGKTCLGFYLTRPDDTVLCSCLDLDNHDGENANVAQDTLKVTTKLDELGFDGSYLVERSQSGSGFHVWMFYDDPLSAALVRRFWKQIIQDTGVRAEIYPKQDSLKGLQKGLGNLVRYPFWRHSCFQSAHGDIWIGRNDDVEAITNVSAVSEREIENCIAWHEEAVDTVVSENGLPLVVETLIRQHPDALLARRWQGDRSGLADRSLSALALSLVHELVRAYISPDDIDVTLEFWGRQNDYQKALRADWRRVTVRKAYDIVAGRGLGNRLHDKGGGTLAALTRGYVDAVVRGEDPIIQTGIEKLDESIGGMAFGEMMVIAARPSHGKSALALEILDQMSGRGLAGLFVSLEMTQHMVSSRLLSRFAYDLPKSEWDSEEVQQQVHERIEKYFENRASIYFEGECSQIDKLQETIETYVAEKDVRVVVVDYQGLAQGKTGNEYADQTAIVSLLKRLAKKHSLLMIDLVQMNRAIEKEKGRAPSMSDLRSSGQIEQDADIILAPRYLCMDDPLADPTRYEIHCLKNRNRGVKIRCVEVTFDASRQTFA